MPKSEPITLEIAGREVRLSNPGKIYFPRAGVTKLSVVAPGGNTEKDVTVVLGARPNGQ